MLRIALTTGLASLFVIGLTTLTGCPPSTGTGEGEGEGEGAAGEGEGEGAGEGEGVAGEGEGEGVGGEGEGEGTASPDICQEECTANSDCTVGGGTNAGFQCTNGRCVQPAAAACLNDQQCEAQANFWSTIGTCNATTACAIPGFDCVDLDGAGPGTDGGCAQDAANGCTAPQVSLTVTDVTGATVHVCGSAQTCNTTSGACEPPACTTDTDCAAGLHCDTAADAEHGKCVQCNANGDCTNGKTTCESDHTCGCTNNNECGTPGTAPSVCDTTTGACGCASNAECTGSPQNYSGDKCDVASGECSCGAAADCTGTKVFDNTSFTCAAP